MSEAVKFMGHLKQHEIDLAQVELEIKGLVNSIRDCLDPFGPIGDLRADEAAQQAVKLAELRIRWNRLTAEIASLKKALRM